MVAFQFRCDSNDISHTSIKTYHIIRLNAPVQQLCTLYTVHCTQAQFYPHENCKMTQYINVSLTVLHTSFTHFYLLFIMAV